MDIASLRDMRSNWGLTHGRCVVCGGCSVDSSVFSFDSAFYVLSSILISRGEFWVLEIGIILRVIEFAELEIGRSIDDGAGLNFARVHGSPEKNVSSKFPPRAPEWSNHEDV